MIGVQDERGLAVSGSSPMLSVIEKVLSPVKIWLPQSWAWCGPTVYPLQVLGQDEGSPAGASPSVDFSPGDWGREAGAPSNLLASGQWQESC